MCYNLFTHAEMREDVVEGFLGGDGAAGDFCKLREGEAEVFSDEVGGEGGMQAVKDPVEGVVGT